MAFKVILDAGHGGKDSGAVFDGRMEKDDALQLAMAVGDILEKNGITTAFTRTSDVYQTPSEKARSANEMGGDLFVSLHRNAYVTPNTGTGVETLVYNDSGMKAKVARNINANLEKLGFENRGVTERPNLTVLRRTNMPAILVEAGFIDNEKDNKLFDEKFYDIAQGIADAIIEQATEQRSTTDVVKNDGDSKDGSLDDLLKKVMSEEDQEMPQTTMQPQQQQQQENMTSPGDQESTCKRCEEMKSNTWYRVQVGAFSNRSYAQRMLRQLLAMGYPAYIVFENDFYKVQVGSYRNLDNAARMEECLRAVGYSTYIRSM